MAEPQRQILSDKLRGAIELSGEWQGMSSPRSVLQVYRFIVDFARNEDGGPLLEFTLLTPVFFLIMFGIIEWGNVFTVKSDMLIAARMAARGVAVGSVSNSAASGAGATTGAFAAACGSATSPTPLTNSTYSYTMTFSTDLTCPAGGNTSNSLIFGNTQVTISTPVLPVMILNYLKMVSSTATLSVSATFQQEYICPATAPPATVTVSNCQCNNSGLSTFC